MLKNRGMNPLGVVAVDGAIKTWPLLEPDGGINMRFTYLFNFKLLDAIDNRRFFKTSTESTERFGMCAMWHLLWIMTEKGRHLPIQNSVRQSRI